MDVPRDPSPPRFILTGSSARKARRDATNLFGGRAPIRTLHPFMAAELPSFELERSLTMGMVPLVVDAQDPGATLAAYVSLYLEQDA